MNSGIYKIVNKVTSKFYIGSSVNFKRRWYMHKFELKREKLFPKKQEIRLAKLLKEDRLQ